MQLNEGQSEAVNQFTAFMLDPTRKTFVLSGGAGTGKTTVIRYIMATQEAVKIAALSGAKYRPPSVWVPTATTNKAAEVLGHALGTEARTIHSTLGLKVKPNFKTGREDLIRTGSEVIENSVILVDECSMIDKDLNRFISECTYNCKYVFIGDHCQLAPVMESLSPVFTEAEPVVLTEIMRSINAPPITELSLQLRQTVGDGIFKPILEVPGYIDYLTPEQAQEEITATFGSDSHPDARILCYTNNKVMRFNNHIRQLRQLPEQYTVGEFVVSNTMSKGSLPGDHKVVPMLRVEEEVEILEVIPDQVYTVAIGNEKYTLPTYSIRTHKGYFTLAQNMDEYRDLIKYLAKQKMWFPYYQLKEWISDLRPRDACTVYKAQGSTYHTAYVDLSDIGTCTNSSQAARMLYVACTRPTNRIAFIGRLPDRLRGA